MASVSGWLEAIVMSLGFLTVFGLMIGGMNDLFGQNNVIPIIDNSTQKAIESFMVNSTEQIDSGEVQFDAQQGITLKSSYAIVKGALNIIFNFVSGGWIENVAEWLNLGEGFTALAKILRVLFFISVLLALLYILFKVTA